MKALTLTADTNSVWSGSDFADINFRGVLPIDLGDVKNANAILLTLSSGELAAENRGKLTFIPIYNITQINGIVPLLTFESTATFGPPMNFGKNGNRLWSYIRQTIDVDGNFNLTARINLKSLSDRIASFMLQLELTTVQKETCEELSYAKLSSGEDSCENQTCRSVQVRSNAVNLTNLKLCIRNLTSSSHHCKQNASETFEWFCKHGGDNAAIEVMVYLKNETGAIVRTPRPLPLKTTLVYDNGEEISLPFSPNKDSKRATNQVYKPMRPDPTIRTGTGFSHFSFRIEDVSKNHRPHSGFKLKVSPSHGPGIYEVATGLMEETIIVKTRPAYGKKSERRNSGGRSTLLQKTLGGIPVLLNTSKPKFKDNNGNLVTAATIIMNHPNGSPCSTLSSTQSTSTDSSPYTFLSSSSANSPTSTSSSSSRSSLCSPIRSSSDILPPKSPGETTSSSTISFISTNETSAMKAFIVVGPNQSIPYDQTNFTLFLTGNGDKCLCCRKKLELGQGFSPTEHLLDCRFYMTLGPSLNSRFRYYQAGSEHSNVSQV